VNAARRWAWLLVLCPLIAGLAGAAVSRAVKPVYEADATILVRPAQTVSAATANVSTSSDEITSTYARLITERPLLSKVISDLKLPVSPDTLTKNVTVTQVTGTTMLNVAVRDTSRTRARAIANRLVRDFIQFTRTIQQQEAQAYTATLQDQITRASQSVDQDQAQINAIYFQAGIAPSPSQQSKLSALQQQLATDRNHYIALSDQLTQIQAQAALAADSVVSASAAELPGAPVSPNLPVNVALAALVGLFLAAGVATLVESLDQTVKDDDELQRRLAGLAIMAHIPFAAGKGKLGDLVVSMGPHSPAIEAYRTLRTNLLFASVDHEVKTIAVTSAAPGEGKSRTAANLAIVLAAAGHQTLLMDADFRRPSQHLFFGRAVNRGLSDLILHPEKEDEIITRPISDEGCLWLLSSGPSPANPSELLGSARTRALLAQLRSRFAYIIVDTPPVNAVTDSALLAAQADAAILVIEHGRTTYGALHHANRQLANVGANVIGAVVNKLRSRGRYGYTSYGYRGYKPSEAAPVPVVPVGSGPEGNGR
jgi:capsular exopolysaccharide synthesis family protein